MKYALNLNTDNRILSVTYEQYAAPGQPIVDYIPEGNVADYLFINNAFVYDPLPEPEPDPNPSPEDLFDILLGVES